MTVGNKHRSLFKTDKRVGASEEPWGTPLVIVSVRISHFLLKSCSRLTLFALFSSVFKCWRCVSTQLWECCKYPLSSVCLSQPITSMWKSWTDLFLLLPGSELFPGRQQWLHLAVQRQERGKISDLSGPDSNSFSAFYILVENLFERY